MDTQQRRAELSAFLRTHRARLTPQQAGLPQTGRRRTPGLRREEVAELAEVSTAWYTYLEQGREIHVSRGALERIANALQLSPEERIHLSWLADQPVLPEPPVTHSGLPPVYQQILDALGNKPAYITGRKTTFLAWNRAAEAIFGDFAAIPEQERNLLWLLFTESEFRQRVVDWERFASDAVASFRASARPYLDDPEISTFITKLKRVSPVFRAQWEEQKVAGKCADHRTFQHPLIGHLTLELASLNISGDPDIKCCVYSALPGSEEEQKLGRLLSTLQEHVPTLK